MTLIGRIRPRATRPVARVTRRRPHLAVPHVDAALRQILHAQRVAEGMCHFFELEHFLRIGLFVDAMQRADPARFQILRHGLVGREHEFLDHAMGDIALAADDAHHPPVFVEFNHRLRKIEID